MYFHCQCFNYMNKIIFLYFSDVLWMLALTCMEYFYSGGFTAGVAQLLCSRWILLELSETSPSLVRNWFLWRPWGEWNSITRVAPTPSLYSRLPSCTSARVCGPVSVSYRLFVKAHVTLINPERLLCFHNITALPLYSLPSINIHL